MGLVVRAHAKLTVSLRLTGVRNDGYHLIDAEMVSLALADTLTFSEGEGLSMSGPYAQGLPLDGSNLVSKALVASHRCARVHVDKQIPAQGGLGGGSADAAAVLRWAGVSDVTIATQLGADVPFCVVGGRARVTGIGDRVEPLEPFSRLFTLVTPPVGVSTVQAFQAWDALGGPRSDRPNDLEDAAVAVAPELARWRDVLTSLAGRRPTLAGSGSTWFFEGHVDGLRDALVAEGLRPALIAQTRTDRP